jgi:UDP-glucose 4-epimerase
MVRAEDLDRYYRIASDTRDLNYALFFERGEQKVAECDDYTSANTRRLSNEELKDMLLQLDYVQHELGGVRAGALTAGLSANTPPAMEPISRQ